MRLIVLLACLIFSCFVRGQVTPRNLLQNNSTAAGLSELILSQGKWKPFPTTSEGWKKILPDSLIQQVIHNG